MEHGAVWPEAPPPLGPHDCNHGSSQYTTQQWRGGGDGNFPRVMAPHQNWRCSQIFGAEVVPRRNPSPPPPVDGWGHTLCVELAQTRTLSLPPASHSSLPYFLDSAKMLWNGFRMRCGIHVGKPEVIFRTDIMKGDYFGPQVNLAARVAGYACWRGGRQEDGEGE